MKKPFIIDHNFPNCYLIFDEDGYLTCSYNHKVYEKCVLTKEEELEE